MLVEENHLLNDVFQLVLHIVAEVIHIQRGRAQRIGLNQVGIFLVLRFLGQLGIGLQVLRRERAAVLRQELHAAFVGGETIFANSIQHHLEQIPIRRIVIPGGEVQAIILLLAHVDDAVHHPCPHNVVRPVRYHGNRVGQRVQLGGLQADFPALVEERESGLLRLYRA